MFSMGVYNIVYPYSFKKYKIMRTRSELESIKNFIDSTYSNFGYHIINVTRKVNLRDPQLGYCFKYQSLDKSYNVYKIVTSPIGIERTDFRILMHEYGHIYLGHLDGIHEELDSRVCDVIENYREELIEKINTSCGIDFADKLLERVIDDPVLNHSLHNIAMDMEVNSTILSEDDINEIESDITSVLPKDEEEFLEYIKDKTDDPDLKAEIEEKLKKLKNESKIKLILPCRYHIDENTPFPDNLTYPDYLIMIIQHLDQFVKMMVSIAQGGNGDTSDITSEDVQNALGQGSSGGVQGQGGGNSQGQQGQGGSGSGMSGLDNLMNQMGMSDDNNSSDKSNSSDKESSSSEKEEKDSPYKGKRSDPSGDKEDDLDSDTGTHKDHRTDSRDSADKKRELGEIRSKGGLGCGSSGTAGATREVTQTDEIDMALDEVMLNYKSKVIKYNNKRDHLYLYNRGIIRTVIAPVVRRTITKTTEPTITFLIDISGSMDTKLVDRCLNTIAKKMKKIGRGLKYNIITWNTSLGEHIQNIDPRKGVPRISIGGGTRMAKGIQYFKDNYGPEAILIVISDFEDYLQEWQEIEKTMSQYTMYGFNYGYAKYSECKDFTHMKIKDFKV